MMTERIRKVLDDPCVSYWLKDALQSAMNRDGLDAMYDAKLLADLLRDRWQAIKGQDQPGGGA